MFEDTTMQALQQFHQRYSSKPRAQRVRDNSKRELRDDIDGLRTDQEKRGLV